MSLSSIFSFTRENSKSARGKSLDPRHSFSRISVNLDRLPLPPFLHPLSLFLFFFSRAVFTLRVNDDAPSSLETWTWKTVRVFYEFVSRRYAQSTASNYLRDREPGESVTRLTRVFKGMAGLCTPFCGNFQVAVNERG